MRLESPVSRQQRREKRFDDIMTVVAFVSIAVLSIGFAIMYGVELAKTYHH